MLRNKQLGMAAALACQVPHVEHGAHALAKLSSGGTAESGKRIGTYKRDIRTKKRARHLGAKDQRLSGRMGWTFASAERRHGTLVHLRRIGGIA